MEDFHSKKCVELCFNECIQAKIDVLKENDPSNLYADKIKDLETQKII